MLTSCTIEKRAAAPCPPAHADHPQVQVAAELADGLCAHQAGISPKFLYDSLGSTLFEAICALPEYYPTRTEAGLFERFGKEIARACGVGTTLIDLGAGNCAKAASLFPRLCPARYVAVDISADFVTDALARLRARFPHIAMEALGLDFSNSLALPDSIPLERRLFFYPGSSLGNFTPPEARAFLRRLRKACGPDGALLIGMDLVKDKAVIDAAYDDALGVTAAFNLNILRHVNRLLGADFDVRGWRHVAFYNEALGRVEMHLEARSAQRVRWPGGGRDFAEGERIQTENSYKYRQADAIALLEQSGFEATRVWLDARCPFAVIHAQAIS
ncbi:L-histidine N(alpha)-methyltransferase [Massilia niabensis]|uniref:L-histidine N(Alpha)-methyltransferase n=1 Tax=Massilia niabensis TaxID=544910 RepID=A0ABW0L2B8_9BURK